MAERNGLRWRQAGPRGGYFKSFAWDSTGRAYAGSDDSGGIWASDDDGLTWSLITGDHVDVTGWMIAVSPHSDDVVCAVDIYARHPLLRSDDRGVTWRTLGLDLPTREARRTSSILFDPTDPERMLVGSGHDEMHHGDGLFQTRDGGRSFVRVAFEGYEVPDIVRAGTSLFAAVLASGRGEPLGLMRSDDGGASWTPVPQFAGRGVSVLTSTPDGELLAGAPGPEGSVWRSRDGGDDWECLGLAGVPIDIAADGSGYVAGCIIGAPGVSRWERGTDWQPAQGLQTTSIMGLGRSPKTGTVLCGNFANWGVARSDDGGRSFSYPDAGPRCVFATDAVSGPAPGQALVSLLGTYELVPGAQIAAATLTDDGGRTWKPAPVGAHGLSVARCAQEPRLMLLGTFRQGIWRSDDGGDSYAHVSTDEIVPAVAFCDPSRALAAVVRIDPATPGLASGIAASDDGGRTWSHVGDHFVRRFAVATTSVVYAAGAAGVLVSHDAGRTWTGIRSGGWQSVAVDPADAQHVVAGSERCELITTTDGGATWRELQLPVDPASTRGVYAIVVRGDQYYVGLSGAEESIDSWGGFLVSPDRGATWQRVGDGLATDHVWALAMDPGGTLFAATYGGGVFQLGAASASIDS